MKPSEWVPFAQKRPKRATGQQLRALLEKHKLKGKEAHLLISHYLNCSVASVPPMFTKGLRMNDLELLETKLTGYSVQRIIDEYANRRRGEIRADGKYHHYDESQLAAARVHELKLKKAYTATKRAKIPGYGRKK